MIFEHLKKLEEWKENPYYMSKEIIPKNSHCDKEKDHFNNSSVTSFIDLNVLRKDGDETEIELIYEKYDICTSYHGRENECKTRQIYSHGDLLYILDLESEYDQDDGDASFGSFYNNLKDLLSSFITSKKPETPDDIIDFCGNICIDEYSVKDVSEFFTALADDNRKLAADAFNLYVSKFVP